MYGLVKWPDIYLQLSFGSYVFIVVEENVVLLVGMLWHCHISRPLSWTCKDVIVITS
jgi:hypothetical protein